MNITAAAEIVKDYILNLDEAASVLNWADLDDDDPILFWIYNIHENHLSTEYLAYCEARYVLGMDDRKEYDFHLYVAETERRISRKQRAHDRVREVYDRYDSEVESGVIGV